MDSRGAYGIGIKKTKDAAQGSFLSEVTCYIIRPGLYSESGKLHSLAMVTRVTFYAAEHLSCEEISFYLCVCGLEHE